MKRHLYSSKMGICFTLKCMIYLLILTSYPVVTTDNGKKAWFPFSNYLIEFSKYFICVFSCFRAFPVGSLNVQS